MTNEKLQVMVNYLTSLPQDKIQEVRLRFDVVELENSQEVVPNLAVIFKD